MDLFMYIFHLLFILEIKFTMCYYRNDNNEQTNRIEKFVKMCSNIVSNCRISD